MTQIFECSTGVPPTGGRVLEARHVHHRHRGIGSVVCGEGPDDRKVEC